MNFKFGILDFGIDLIFDIYNFTQVVFEKRKIQFETLGEYLGEVRRGLKLSIGQVSEKTSIKTIFLQNLEAGKYEFLPPDVYILGFIRQLAGLYALDFNILVVQYKKEKNIFFQLEKNRLKKNNWKKIFLKKFVITPKNLSVFSGLFLFVLAIVYIVWQVMSINKTPFLDIYQPMDKQVIKESFVKILGKTDPGMSLTVNGQSIFVGLDGKFETQISISSGPQEIYISSKNRFDKSVFKVISVVGELISKNTQGAGVNIQVEFSGHVEFVFAIDDELEQTAIFENNNSREILAQRKIVISSSDGGATKIVVNGKSMGVLGRKGEKISKMIFFPDQNGMNLK